MKSVRRGLQLSGASVMAAAATAPPSSLDAQVDAALEAMRQSQPLSSVEGVAFPSSLHLPFLRASHEWTLHWKPCVNPSPPRLLEVSHSLHIPLLSASD